MHHIHKFRARPDHHKHMMALFVALLGTGLAATVWLGGFDGPAKPAVASGDELGSPVSAMFANVSSAWDSFTRGTAPAVKSTIEAVTTATK